MSGPPMAGGSDKRLVAFMFKHGGLDPLHNTCIVTRACSHFKTDYRILTLIKRYRGVAFSTYPSVSHPAKTTWNNKINTGDKESSYLCSNPGKIMDPFCTKRVIVSQHML